MNKLICLLLFVPAIAFAQGSMSAKDIIAKINSGEAVTCKNMRIDGDIDLTHLSNMKLYKAGVKEEDMWTKMFVSTVNATLSFSNCTFTGNVLAYYNPDNEKRFGQSKNEVYNTNFNAAISFTGCTFEKDAAFKYSKFNSAVSFAGSRFRGETVFKYSEFSSSPDFTKAAFDEGVIFKYVTFPAGAKFGGATFKDHADFKYAQFKSGADFSSAIFNGMADFKYSKFSNPNFKGTQFNGDEDFKYTEANGKKVNAETLVK